MPNEHGEWIMYGVGDDDPRRIKSAEELMETVDRVGFLPLFKNSVPGFSVEERTVPYFWWTGDAERDPWEWRTIAARSGKVAYGKFFGKKAGFLSLQWLPTFANWRRDGYDFDARYDDGKAPFRQKKIMDLFSDGEEYFSYQAKQKAGFGKGGEKNFDGVVTELEMMTYLVIKDFRCRRNKMGEEYGWSIAVLSAPESIWGSELVSSAYGEAPEESYRRILEHMKELYPDAGESQIKSIIGKF